MSIKKQLQDSAIASMAEDNGPDIMFRAAGIGNMDRGRDVICPGAFSASCLADFLREGTILFNHDYRAEPIAMPISAQEVGRYLMIGAKWHSTEFAASKKIIAEERMAAGKQVGSSIGFYPHYKYFESGADLLAWAAGSGYDMTLFDSTTIRAHEGSCWAIPKVDCLAENSLLGVLPMNPEAEVEALKRALDEVAARTGDPDGAIKQKFAYLRGEQTQLSTDTPRAGLIGVSMREADARLRLRAQS